MSTQRSPSVFRSAFEECLDGREHLIADQIRSHQAALDVALTRMSAEANQLAVAAGWIVETLRAGKKLLVVGNGGSAAEAQHFVAELVGRFKHDRKPYSALALTTDSAVLTAIANDFGYEEVFARQIDALGQPGDLLVAFSTSGESVNVLKAGDLAGRRGMRVIAITADRTSRLEGCSDLTIKAPVADTATAQELHMVMTHLLCEVVESQLLESGAQVEAVRL